MLVLEFRVKARLGSMLGAGLETPGVRNAWVRKGLGTKCLEAFIAV